MKNTKETGCKYMFFHDWEQGQPVCDVSCIYYWMNPHLIDKFVSQIIDKQYNYQFDFDTRVERGIMSMSGHSGSKEDYVIMLTDEFHRFHQSKNFPYSFVPEAACKFCEKYK